MNTEAREYDLTIEGLNCGGCVSKTEKALNGVDGVSEASVNLATGKARVQAGKSVSLGALKEAVQQAGFDVATETFRFQVTGMHCGSCVSRVEEAARRGERPPELVELQRVEWATLFGWCAANGES